MNNFPNLSYACINLTLQEQGIYTGRSLIQKTFKAKGLDYVSGLALQNAIDLKKIIEWNIANGFKLFRISSNIFPWWSEYNIQDLKDFIKIYDILLDIGDLTNRHKHRLSFHPDHFNKLGSGDEAVVQKTLKDIEQHSFMFDLMALVPSNYNKINIHVGGSYGDKVATLKRFCDNFKRLSTNAKQRLTVENDDKEALYSVKELYDGIYKVIGIPIVFDYHHHSIYDGGLSQHEAFEMAYSTWNVWNKVIPVCHYSESKEGNLRGHSDYIKTDEINQYGKVVDIIIEAKAKELAVLDFSERKSKKSLTLLYNYSMMYI
jgi:UV DNA damage endonuclease